jgi:hypothetical protein
MISNKINNNQNNRDKKQIKKLKDEEIKKITIIL